MEQRWTEDQRDITERIRQLQAQLTAAAWRFDQAPLLLAVTKQQPAERINLLREAGIHQIGESRVQDWQRKSANLMANFNVHWIGRLQTNKVKYIIRDVCLVHSLDRPALAEEIDACARAVERRVPVLVQVNIAGEPQKAGVSPDDLERFIAQYGTYPGLWIQGLMAIMPIAENPETLRPYFRDMRERFESIQKKPIPGVEMRHLSMGMSADCLIAAQEGATIVRVGSAIFGARAS